MNSSKLSNDIIVTSWRGNAFRITESYWMREGNQLVIGQVIWKAFPDGFMMRGFIYMLRYFSHYSDAIMGAIAPQITSLTIVYSTIYLDADQKHQISASLAFVRGIYRGSVNSPHKWPVTRKMFPFDDVIINTLKLKQKGRPFCRWHFEIRFLEKEFCVLIKNSVKSVSNEPIDY